MTTIAIGGAKGGVGKTTIAVNLAHFFAQTHATVLIDTDPQAHAVGWDENYSAREGDNTLRPFTLGLPKKNITRDVQHLQAQYAHAIVDLPGGLGSVTMSALECCGLFLMPVRPGPMDFRALERTVTLVQNRIEACSTPKAAFVVTQARAGTKSAEAVGEDVAETYSLPVCCTVIPMLEDFMRTGLRGESVFSLAEGASARRAMTELIDELAERELCHV